MVYSPKWSRIQTIAPLYSTLPDMGKAGCPRYIDKVGLAITPWGKVRGSAPASGKRSEGWRSGAPWTVADLGSATGTVRSTLWDHLTWREIPLDNHLRMGYFGFENSNREQIGAIRTATRSLLEFSGILFHLFLIQEALGWHMVWIQHGLATHTHENMGMSENGVYPQWNSHLIGIMISKTIGIYWV